jgi:RimJ/RimL family protein N-acetyltransferase
LIRGKISVIKIKYPEVILMNDKIIETERLILRQWRDSDLMSMAKINADHRVMEHFPAVKTFDETQQFINGNRALFKEVGFCFYATELKGTQELIGFVGIAPVSEMPCGNAIEIGWRLGAQFWGQGYATEAARAVIDYAFNILNIKELVSFTATTNKKSESLMQRLGFIRSQKDDFDHPRIADGHPLRRHIFYRLTNNLDKD